jgi:hypothetical protein
MPASIPSWWFPHIVKCILERLNRPQKCGVALDQQVVERVVDVDRMLSGLFAV